MVDIDSCFTGAYCIHHKVIVHPGRRTVCKILEVCSVTVIKMLLFTYIIMSRPTNEHFYCAVNHELVMYVQFINIYYLVPVRFSRSFCVALK
jgi:hypothetical protein